MSIGRIIVSLEARTGSFETDIARASKQAERRAREIDAAFSKAGKALGGMAVAAGGAIVLAIQQTTSLANEITNLAQISGAGVVEFQKYAAGAAQVGINQEKLSDQLKDFREKTGEFLATGGGGMKDFFEQIAPQIGLTAEAFRDLSGPQALQLYYDSLEKAGLSQEKMSFYLESMASDTTALIPLLRDGGAGFRKAGEDAERMGSILNEKTITAAVQLRKDMDLLSSAMQGLITNSVGPLIEELAKLTTSFVNARKEGRSFWQSLMDGTRLEAARSEMAKLYEERERLIAQQQKLNDTIGGDEHRAAGPAGDALRKVEERLAANRAQLMKLGDLAKELQIIEQGGLAQLPGTGGGTIIDTVLGDPKEAEKRAQRVRDIIGGLEKDIARFGKNSTQVASLDAFDAGVTKEQLDKVYELGMALSDMADRQKVLAEMPSESERAFAAMAEEGRRLFDETRTPAEALASEIERINQLLQAGVIDWDTYARAQFNAQDRFDELTNKAKDTTKELDNFAVHAAENIQDVIADSLVASTDSSFREIAANFAKMIQRMLAEALAADIAKSLFGDLVKGGEGKGLFGNLLGTIGGWLTGASGKRAAGGPVAAGGLYEVGELNRPELFSAGGRQFLIPGNAGRISPVTSGARLPEQVTSRPVEKTSWTIVNNTSSKIGRVTEQRISDTERALIIEEAVDAAWAQPNDPNSRASRVLSRNFNMRRSR